eukprot:COSAG01_NODE_29735_length_630_cov_4.939736_1_plen_70_part_10
MERAFEGGRRPPVRRWRGGGEGWSEEIYVITDKRGDTGKPLKYKVRPEDSDEPLKDWYDHASLQKITRAL